MSTINNTILISSKLQALSFLRQWISFLESFLLVRSWWNSKYRCLSYIVYRHSYGMLRGWSACSMYRQSFSCPNKKQMSLHIFVNMAPPLTGNCGGLQQPSLRKMVPPLLDVFLWIARWQVGQFVAHSVNLLIDMTVDSLLPLGCWPWELHIRVQSQAPLCVRKALHTAETVSAQPGPLWLPL